MNRLSRYFTHYRDTGHDRPWFAIGPVLHYRPRLSGDTTTAVRAGVYVTLATHTVAVHRENR